MKKNSFVEGTIIASLSLILVKVLGAIYVIPFYDIVGELGGALYSYAYTVYSLVLNVCTAGIPLAISKIVSEYNTLEMYDAEKKIYFLNGEGVEKTSEQMIEYYKQGLEEYKEKIKPYLLYE